MSTTVMRIAAVAAVSMSGLTLAGCGSVPDQSQAANVIVLATATSNEPGSQLPIGFDQTLRAANATQHGTLTVLMPRGGKTEQVGDPVAVAVTREGSGPENDPQMIDEGLQRISNTVGSRVTSLASNEPVLDLLTGLNDAARRAPKSTIVAISSGLQDTGLADFAGLGWDFRNVDVVDNLRARGFLPDLSGKKVLFVGLGNTAGSVQAPLPAPMQTKVQSLWVDICHAGGADRCDTARAASDVPAVSTAPAKTVAVPTFALPPLPDDGGSMPLATEALFAPDSADLLPQAQGPLATLADELRTRSATVDLVGHTWSVGPANTARTLSRQRAQAVANALLAHGLPAQHLGSVTGVGYDAPVSSGGADGAAAANRVVVLTVRTS
ncbi:OmpA family protein [Mycolicibacterium llatzerense]|uniref:OmpA family protein n=1 Tax=Mycolicibacterium llatzerense TaxID=280871 RepID=UPI0008DC5CF1|nr:OmpA family protein [Mycolicibacterium llatzerense]